MCSVGNTWCVSAGRKAHSCKNWRLLLGGDFVHVLNHHIQTFLPLRAISLKLKSLLKLTRTNLEGLLCCLPCGIEHHGVTQDLMCLFFFSPSVPGLFEGVPGANRARAGHQPAAGPAVPAGERGQSGKQGEGAAGPVQHPHRCPRRQLMNLQRGSWLSEPMN